jgi:hypothetical protein
MSDVRSIGTVDDECFATTAPNETEVLLGSIGWGAAAEGVGNI